ncbi:MAG TPA: carcinine hydrolase/isopenicillin-N N-acyltransferase family protein, partial [Bacteroidales bacterium]|nr:carcinine hydrolase/isopenicillin-N N-acyltransferase family protein [Bacteroidales bacterium]
MKKHLFIFAVFLISGFTNFSEACTTFIISGRYTPDSRPILYKHRDTGVTDNALAVFSDGKYNYVGLLNSDKNWNNEVWGGFNSAGFAIMNSVAYNKNIGDTTGLADQEGRIMKLALQNCATVDDFEKLLAELPKPLGVDTNFGVIDALGGAAYFETGNYGFEKIDANDAAAAPYGYLIRTNHAFTGPVDKGFGYIRYSTANEALYRAAAMNRYDPQYLISNISRNLYHSLTDVNLRDVLPADSEREKFVFFEDFIPRYSSASAICVAGTKAGEDPSGTVMWTLCGFPLTTAVVPVWLTKDKILPAAVSMKDDLHSPLCDAALRLKDRCFPVKRGSGTKYLNLAALLNGRNTGILQLLESFENEIFKKADELIRSAPGMIPDEKGIGRFYSWL